MARSISAAGLLPTILVPISLILVSIILAAGANNALSQVYYLKTETKDFKAPAKLSNSTFLQDLSALTGTDYVGTGATAQSMGLADFYTVHLLTLCANTAGRIECNRPDLNYAFRPGTDLRLDGTSQSAQSQDLQDALDRSARAHRFLIAAYVGGALMITLATLMSCFSGRSRVAGVAASTLGIVITILWFAASLSSTLLFKRINDAYNANFINAGLTSTLGVIPIALSFVATFLVLMTTCCFMAQTRRGLSSGAGAEFYGDNKARGFVTGQDQAFNGGQKPSVWGRVATWKRHPYTQVERQPVLGQNNRQGMGGHDADPEESVRQRLDHDWATHDDYMHDSTRQGGNNASIPLLTIGGNHKSLDASTAYEPFKDRPT